MNLKTFREFLTALRDESGAHLCGSFARGEPDSRPGFLSDIDLVVAHGEREDEWGDPLDRPIDAALRVFERFHVPAVSIIVGQVSSPRDLHTLPRPVEVMTTVWIDPDPSYAPRVSVCGVEFETFRRREDLRERTRSGGAS